MCYQAICLSSIFQSEVDEPPQEPAEKDWFGYKFVGDNIDKNLKPSFQRAEQRGLSLHQFHGYAVRDRINFSKLSDEPPAHVDPDPLILMPSSDHLSAFKDELNVLISR